MPNQIPAVPHLDLVGGRPVATSLNVADVFGKRHAHVLRSIETLDAPEEFTQPNFGLSSYRDVNGKSHPMYTMTRDGFTLLAMGFTGKEAMRFKIAYIELFNRMEAQLAGRPVRTVDVNHSYFRTTAAPGGLDIRYTLDLTAIIRKPTQTGIELLERLTGIEMDDLAEAAGSALSAGEPETFIARWYAGKPGVNITFAEIYAEYQEFADAMGISSGRRASRKRFGKALSNLGYSKAKLNCGTTTILDIYRRGGE